MSGRITEGEKLNSSPIEDLVLYKSQVILDNTITHGQWPMVNAISVKGSSGPQSSGDNDTSTNLR